MSLDMSTLKELMCQCEYCHQFQKSSRFRPSMYQNTLSSPDLMFVDESFLHTRYQTSPQLSNLSRLLATYGLDTLTIYKTHLIKCEAGSSLNAYDVCLPFTQAEISVLQPKAIILFGMEPARRILGKNLFSTFLKRNLYQDIPTFTTYSIGQIEDEPAYLPQVNQHFKYISENVKHLLKK